MCNYYINNMIKSRFIDYNDSILKLGIIIYSKK